MWKPTKPPFVAHKNKIYKQITELEYIYQIGESDNLRKKSSNVKLSDIKSAEFRSKVKYLKDCLRSYRKTTGMGRGITGIQVGISESVAVIYMPEVKGEMLIIINPKVLKKSKSFYVYPEICMSASPIIASVKRSSWIEFEYYDETGNMQVWNKKDKRKEDKIYNRVFQHEIDHMDGIINIDLVSSKTLILESDPTFYEKASFTED